MTISRDPLADALRDAVAEEPVPAGDDALLARAIAGATERLAAGAPARRARPARALRVALPLAAAFAASVALASLYVTTRPPPSPVVGAAGPRTDAPAAPVAPSATPHEVSPAEVPLEPIVLVRDLPSARISAAVTPPSNPGAISPRAPGSDPVTAAELFRDANAARRGGDVGGAIERYRRLQRVHPEAPESAASRVSLGRLLLDREGDAKGALAQFDAYLSAARADQGTLAEEARLGRALSLQRLGRARDERRAWEELVAHHPRSVHAGRARERLDALGGR